MTDEEKKRLYVVVKEWIEFMRAKYGYKVGPMIDAAAHEAFGIEKKVARNKRCSTTIFMDQRAIKAVLTNDPMHISQIHERLGRNDNANVTPDLGILRKKGDVIMGPKGYYRLANPAA